MQAGLGSVREAVLSLHAGFSAMQDSAYDLQNGLAGVKEETAGAHEAALAVTAELTAMRGEIASLQEAAETVQSETNRMQARIQALREVSEADGTQLRDLLEKIGSGMQEMKTSFDKNDSLAEEIQTSLKVSGEGLEEYVHRESVKVYRNVQAILTEELKSQTKELCEKMEQDRPVSKWLYGLIIVTLLVSMGNLGLLIAWLCGLVV